MKKKIISALLAAVMVFSLTACGGGSDKKSADGTYYNTYLDTDPTTMDPVKGNDTYSMGILRNIMEPLTRMEEDGDKQERKGAGAESWESNDDGTVWTFHLRDNKWSDGEPVTADDYVYGMKQTLDPEESAGEGYGLAPIGHVVSVASASPVSIEVKTTVTFEEGHNWSNTKAAIAEAVDAYFLELRKNWTETSQTIVRVSQIENRILGVDGVVDVTVTKLNGTASNMTLTEFCIPKLGGVSA